MSKEELQAIDEKPFDIREFYYKISSNTPMDDDVVLPPARPIRPPTKRLKKSETLFDKPPPEDWEVKRVERPVGVAQWGEMPKSKEEQEFERGKKWV
ncbi:hypothetical protein [Phaffia rhodozyma]|uniref:Uncharacterized protein n=1 Tax=Phaffia rhodozyma TaxID=264483 RepID=A0A0F7SNH1_PHARH|nr:hypothetical protein [Phaffia rhodozyma]